MSEVLVVPAWVLGPEPFEGFRDRDPDWLDELLVSGLARFAPRAEAEEDTRLKQLIPYVVLECGASVFCYRRKGGGEGRLEGLRSLGVGGHLEPCDGQNHHQIYWNGLARELREEMGLHAFPPIVGYVNEEETAVGRVHLGIVHRLVVGPQDRLQAREACLAQGGFLTLDALGPLAGEFEIWSQHVLRGLYGIPVA